MTYPVMFWGVSDDRLKFGGRTMLCQRLDSLPAKVSENCENRTFNVTVLLKTWVDKARPEIDVTGYQS